MKQLGSESDAKVPDVSIEQALGKHDPEYVALIKSHPELLNPNFQKGKPVHNVWHRIDTADHAPCKAKRRPVLADK